MNDQTTSLPPGNESEIDDDAIGASIKIDWEEIIAADDPGDPEEMIGGVLFDSADYETEGGGRRCVGSLRHETLRGT